MSSAFWIRVGATSMALAVALGAFGAHGLKERVEPAMLEVWKTATHYQALHALALILLGVLLQLFAAPRATAAGWLFVVGSVVFSGTLYALVLSNVRWLGAITPIGGLAFISGWVVLATTTWIAR